MISLSQKTSARQGHPVRCPSIQETSPRVREVVLKRLRKSDFKDPVQSALSKAGTFGTKATVRLREVSALERIQLRH